MKESAAHHRNEQRLDDKMGESVLFRHALNKTIMSHAALSCCGRGRWIRVEKKAVIFGAIMSKIAHSRGVNLALHYNYSCSQCLLSFIFEFYFGIPNTVKRIRKIGKVTNLRPMTANLRPRLPSGKSKAPGERRMPSGLA